MEAKLKSLAERHKEVADLLIKPETMQDMNAYGKLNKEYKELSKVIDKWDELKQARAGLEEAKEMLKVEKDPEMREMAKLEIEEQEPRIDELNEELKLMLIPKDPNDSHNVILEIRQGAGGDEAAIFAGDLFRMYQRYAETQGWKMSVIDVMEGTAGGYKEVVASVEGEDVYAKMKFESGVHRVQRVPATETQGRIHTSAASVVVLPEVEEVDVQLNMNEIRKDTFCSSGPGGQSVNTTYSAIRLTHLPTGMIVSCQDEKSQIKNYEKALKVMRARIHEIEVAKQQEEIGAQRKSMVGSGDRSDKIRTYNWPQSRVTDHRIGKTVHNLDAVISGNIDEFVEALRIADNAERLQADTDN